jgi:hypothetical protein
LLPKCAWKKKQGKNGLQQLKYAAKASNNLGLNAHATLVDLTLAVFPSLALWTMDLG